jgi:serine/threonine protein kinase
MKLMQSNDESTWVTLKSNTIYILREVLKGIVHLHDQHIQHGDLKGK